MKTMEKRRVVAGVVIAVAVLQVGFAAVVRWQRASAEAALQAAGDRLLDLEDELETARTAPVVENVPEPSPWQLTVAADVPGTLRTIQQLGDEHGVELVQLKANASSAAEKQTYRTVGIAEPTALCEFIASIETATDLVVVETGRILPDGPGTVGFELGLATYHEGTAEAGR